MASCTDTGAAAPCDAADGVVLAHSTSEDASSSGVNGGGERMAHVENGGGSGGADADGRSDPPCGSSQEARGGGREGGEDDADGFTQLTSAPYVSAQVQRVVEELATAFDDLRASLQKANILLVGKTGVGKSSLVNAVFGGDFAETGNGEPVTKHLTRYAPAHKDVVVFDTRGLEHGNHDVFVEETLSFLEELRSSDDLREHLHVVWYVIDMSHARFQPFEERICREILAGVPLFFVLNKVDTAEASQVASIRGLVESQAFPSCRGVFEVVCDRQNYSPACCPKCGSEDIRVRHKRQQILCDNDAACGESTLMSKTAGLEQLVSVTIEELPHLARHSFVNAQEVNETARVHEARAVIMQCANVATMKKSQIGLIQMATHLALLWNYKFFPSLVSQDIAHVYYRRYQSKSLMRRIALVIKDAASSHRVSVALTVAIGVELCRMLCELKMQAVGYALRPGNSAPAPAYDDDAFYLDLSDEWIHSIELQMKKQRLEEVIDHWLRQKVVVFWREVSGVSLTLQTPPSTPSKETTRSTT